jgi:hypothetical protein
MSSRRLVEMERRVGSLQRRVWLLLFLGTLDGCTSCLRWWARYRLSQESRPSVRQEGMIRLTQESRKAAMTTPPLCYVCLKPLEGEKRPRPGFVEGITAMMASWAGVGLRPKAIEVRVSSETFADILRHHAPGTLANPCAFNTAFVVHTPVSPVAVTEWRANGQDQQQQHDEDEPL